MPPIRPMRPTSQRLAPRAAAALLGLAALVVVDHAGASASIMRPTGPETPPATAMIGDSASLEQPSPPTVTGAGCYDIGNVAEAGSVQTASRSTPPGSGSITWQNPSVYTSIASFRGSNNRPASHEGTDFVHTNTASAPTVYAKAPADGVVVYCQTGCLQSTELGSNTSSRECGQGWGNHVVIRHGNGTSIPYVYTRICHLKPGTISVTVGDTVRRGQTVALMGNTGRSDTRHIHLELGTKATGFAAGAKSQNFDRVWDFELLRRSAATNTP